MSFTDLSKIVNRINKMVDDVVETFIKDMADIHQKILETAFTTIPSTDSRCRHRLYAVVFSLKSLADYLRGRGIVLTDGEIRDLVRNYDYDSIVFAFCLTCSRVYIGIRTVVGRYILRQPDFMKRIDDAVVLYGIRLCYDRLFEVRKKLDELLKLVELLKTELRDIAKLREDVRNTISEFARVETLLSEIEEVTKS
mgnify:FL=1